MAQTLVELFHRAVQNGGEQPALYVFRDGSFQSNSWQEFADKVYRYAALLDSIGIRRGQRIAQVSENREEWLYVDLAAHLCGAVHVALHATLTGPQIAEQIADCDPALVIASTAAQLAKLSLDRPTYSHDKFLEYPAAFCGRLGECAGTADPARGKQLETESLALVRSDTLATILYTSGTTGEPKGVMLSHGNLASNAQACADAFGSESENRRLCWLPLSHIFARTSDLYTWLALGSQMALARSRETLVADLAMVRPTFINGVPYFFDKLARHLHDAGQVDRSGALAGLLGGRIRTCCAGGAALSDDTARFFEQQGVQLVQGYGLTESSPVISTGTRARHRIGTVGPPLPGVEVRIADDGEILTRGPHVMLGYWGKPDATAEVIRDGWLHTGDLGVLKDGFLRITGRKKEIIVLSSGKNVAPALIERLLCDDPLIAQAMVVGDGRNYLVALIVPDPERMKKELSNRQSEAASPLVDPGVLALFRRQIDARLACLSAHEQIGRFALLDRAFSVEAAELTPTLKLRRREIAAHFAAEIDSLYA